MASPCVVKYCKNIGTHRFPKNEFRKSQWTEAIKHVVKEGLTIRKNSLICSNHFLPSDYYGTPADDRARKVLKRTAIPSVFSWTPKATQDTQDQPKQSSKDSLMFDSTKVGATYAKTPPIAFAEVQPFLQTTSSDILEDPLLLSHRESKLLLDDDTMNLDDGNIVQIEIGITRNDTEELQDVQLSQQPQDKSVQTMDVTMQDHSKCHFSIHHHKDDDKSLHFYTGLESYVKLMMVFYSLGESVHNLSYFYGEPPEKVDALDQFFITLIILRRHKTFEEISMLYKITLKHVYTIFITWIRYMSLQWEKLDLWTNKENVRAYMPLDFNDKYPDTRAILDATECPVKKPKLPVAQQVTFSSYKNRNTIKILIAISPGGMITYVSPSYGGSATDRQIIERSSILTKFDYNDEIMVDKGLNVQDIFIPYGVKVNMPAFFKKGNQIASGTLSSNRKVASKRVHVERVIGMLKTYKILTEPMNQTETLLSSDIVFICAMLVNFRSNIINKNA